MTNILVTVEHTTNGQTKILRSNTRPTAELSRTHDQHFNNSRTHDQQPNKGRTHDRHFNNSRTHDQQPNKGRTHD